MEEEILYSIALRRSNLVGDIVFKKLVDASGSAKECWQLSKKLLKEIPGIGKTISQQIGKDEHLFFAEKEVDFCLKNNIKVKLRHQNQLPTLLSECEDAPAILYQKGDFDEESIPVSIVGTRNMTSYGKHFVEDFFAALSNKKIHVISGLALGTDTCAHINALHHKLKTSAVLAHGLHTLYPSQNRKLSNEILEKGGALLTEFNSSEKPDREHFLQRNRVVAGLSPVTIIVESAYGGGSMSTLSYANQYNREVFALPGKFYDKYSQGCNWVISQNKARIISSFTEILDELGLGEKKEKTGNLFTFKDVELSEELQPIYNVIAEKQKISLDEICEILGVPPFKILPVLLDLELKGHIKALSGKQYSVN